VVSTHELFLYLAAGRWSAYVNINNRYTSTNYNLGGYKVFVTLYQEKILFFS